MCIYTVNVRGALRYRKVNFTSANICVYARARGERTISREASLSVKKNGDIVFIAKDPPCRTPKTNKSCPPSCASPAALIRSGRSRTSRVFSFSWGEKV